MNIEIKFDFQYNVNEQSELYNLLKKETINKNYITKCIYYSSIFDKNKSIIEN